MTTTGWLDNDEPDELRPTMPTTSFMLASRPPPGQARTLGEVLERAGLPGQGDGEPAEDPDERFAAMIARGYAPGRIQQLTQELSDVSAALTGERTRLDLEARRTEHFGALHQAGRISAFDVMRLTEPDEGESQDSHPGLHELERRQASLQRQLDEAHELTSPLERRDLDPFEAAASRAHRTFVEATRAKMTEMAAHPPAPRPFASVSRVAADTDDHPYPPGAVITTEYAEVSRYLPTPACSGCGHVSCRCGQ